MFKVFDGKKASKWTAKNNAINNKWVTKIIKNSVGSDINSCDMKLCFRGAEWYQVEPILCIMVQINKH